MTYSLRASYLSDTCTGPPYYVNASNVGDACVNETCVDAGSSSSGDVDRSSIVCASDYVQATKELYSGSQFLLKAIFKENNCTNLDYAAAYSASGTCMGGTIDDFFSKAFLNANGTGTIQWYTSRSALPPVTSTVKIKENLASHSCDGTGNQWYISNDESTENSTSSDGSTPSEVLSGSDSSGISVSAVIGIVIGVIVVVGIILGFVFYRRRSNSKQLGTAYASLDPGDTASLGTDMLGQRGLWNDDIITAKRIPRDKIKIKKLVSRGAYGEVYTGVFNRQTVAIKMLIPASRANLQQVNAFLAEAKMTATMDHPHVVSFVGVAWDSLSDLCVVLEFMDGGDLRTLLDKYLASKHAVGFDKQKVTIALHVCHALTYLHSLAPPVIHRDLKSRNILLTKTMEAKLTDFGISRERLDSTMTAGVGTSLWMTPEVMLGEKYDVKADMFSFGVVLSELDVHTLPYALAKKQSREASGRELADATLLQNVATGSVRVEFSESNLRSITELGNACVAVDPNDRPSAAEALYKLQVILAQELS